MALIAYLAVTGQGQARDALATLLWSEYDQSRARAALRRTLSTLNRALGGAWIVADRETIDLRRGDDLRVDVETFRTHLAEVQTHDHPEAETCPDCLSRLAEAAAPYRDDFMAGFTLRDSPDFDDWQFFQAESLRRDLANALERLARTYCTLGEYEPAVDYARRWLRLDPLHEEAHRQLMQLYTWTDQRPAALRQYQECARILEEELGVPPSEETSALFERIQSGEIGRGTEEQRNRGEISPSAPPLLCSLAPPLLCSLAPPARPSAPPTPAFLTGAPRPRTHTPFVPNVDEAGPDLSPGVQVQTRAAGLRGGICTLEARGHQSCGSAPASAPPPPITGVRSGHPGPDYVNRYDVWGHHSTALQWAGDAQRGTRRGPRVGPELGGAGRGEKLHLPPA